MLEKMKTAGCYLLLILAIIVYKGEVSADGSVQETVAIEHTMNNIIASHDVIRSLDKNAIFLITGIDLEKDPSLPWQSAKYFISEFGEGRRFELLTPDDQIKSYRRMGSGTYEGRYMTLANGSFIESHPPDYVLSYGVDQKLQSVRKIATKQRLSANDVAKLIPDMQDVMRGRTLQQISGPEIDLVEKIADKWGAFDSLAALSAIRKPQSQKDLDYATEAKAREDELRQRSFTEVITQPTIAATQPLHIQLQWSVPDASSVQIRVNTPDGPMLSEFTSVGSANVDAGWATAQTKFYLQDVTLNKPVLSNSYLAVVDGSRALASNTNSKSMPTPSSDTSGGGSARKVSSDASAVPSVTPITGATPVQALHHRIKLITQDALPGTVFKAVPDVIQASNEAALPAAFLKWQTAPGRKLEIHMQTPDGTLFTGVANVGSTMTGQWVQPGVIFFLQDETDATPGKTLAKIIVDPCDKC